MNTIERVEGIRDFAVLHFVQSTRRVALVTDTSSLRGFGDESRVVVRWSASAATTPTAPAPVIVTGD